MSAIHHQIHTNDNNKPWILLIHGLFGNLDNLSALRRLFAKDFQVLSIDLPDHGKSEFTEEFSFEHYAALITDLLAKLKINNLTILGHSLGGKIAMQIALNHPDLVTNLVVVDIAPVEYLPRHTNVFAGLNNVDLSQLTCRQEADSQLKQHIQETSTRQFLLKSLYNENQLWKWRFNLTLLERDYQKLSSALCTDIQYKKPVLFIKGGNSNYLLAQHRPHILSLFPNSQSKIIGDTGHWLHAEKPALCHKLAYAFIKSKSDDDI